MKQTKFSIVDARKKLEADQKTYDERKSELLAELGVCEGCSLFFGVVIGLFIGVVIGALLTHSHW